jgi:uncharacterized membrane protein
MFSVNDFLIFQIHGGSGGIAEALGNFLAFIDDLLTKSPEQMFVTILPGFAAMPNIHPLLVHFPIALLLIFFFIDVLGSLFSSDNMRRVAGYFLYIGTISAVLTVIAGLQAATTVPHGMVIHAIIERHEMFGFTVTILAFLLSIWRLLVRGFLSGFANFIYLFMAGLTCLMLTLGADLGGMMVYKHGVGVAAVPKSSLEGEPGHSHNHGHSRHKH